MADVSISYKGSVISEFSDTTTKTLSTSGKFCEGDIVVEYTKPSGGGSGVGGVIYQDEDGYLVLSEEAANVIGITRTLDENGGEILDIVGVSLAEDTVTPATLAQGVTAHNAAGEAIVGTMNVVDLVAFGQISGDIVITGSGTVKSYAFSENRSITSVEADSIATISERAFSNCQGITSASFLNCTNIGNYAFYNCGLMSDITLPADKNITIGSYAFYYCWGLNGADFSNVITVGQSGFRDCWGKNCLFNPITVNDSGFRDMEYLGVEFWGRLTTINGTYSFAGAYDPSNYSTGTVFVAPLLTTIGGADALSYNDCLTCIDIGNLSSIPANTMRDNANLDTLVLRRSSGITALANITAFTDTPFASGGTGGTLYVPQSLKSQYEQATNWSVILGYANNSIVAIEGSYYETHYADGTPIPTT